jgi:hypothetical protein
LPRSGASPSERQSRKRKISERAKINSVKEKRKQEVKENEQKRRPEVKVSKCRGKQNYPVHVR